MTNNYILVPISERNEFRTNLRFKFKGIENDVSCKIDTGAMKTLIPLKTAGYPDDFCKKHKKEAIQSKVKCGFARGIERADTSHLSLEDNPSVVFKYKLSDLKLSNNFCDYSLLKNYDVSISYDTTGNILIGMDILKDFQFLCDVSNVTGELVFLGCLRDSINNDYLAAVEEHFGYVRAERELARKLRDNDYRYR